MDKEVCRCCQHSAGRCNMKCNKVHHVLFLSSLTLFHIFTEVAGGQTLLFHDEVKFTSLGQCKSGLGVSILTELELGVSVASSWIDSCRTEQSQWWLRTATGALEGQMVSLHLSWFYSSDSSVLAKADLSSSVTDGAAMDISWKQCKQNLCRLNAVTKICLLIFPLNLNSTLWLKTRDLFYKGASTDSEFDPELWVDLASVWNHEFQVLGKLIWVCSVHSGLHACTATIKNER